MLGGMSDALVEKVADRAIGLMWKRARNRVGEWTKFIPNVEPYMRFISLGVSVCMFLIQIKLSTKD